MKDIFLDMTGGREVPTLVYSGAKDADEYYRLLTENTVREMHYGASLYGIQFTNDGQIVIFGGGEPLKIGDRVIGGLGVSGGSEEQDAALAAYGAEIFARLVNHA